MNLFIIILGIVIIIGLILFYNNESPYIQQKHKTRDILSTRHNRVRCPPEIQKPKKKCQDMQLYEDNNIIRQRGFVNEMIYKPEHDISDLKFENKLIENNEVLNVPQCQKVSSDLPIANINVHYLMNHQTSKLI